MLWILVDLPNSYHQIIKYFVLTNNYLLKILPLNRKFPSISSPFELVALRDDVIYEK